MKCTPYSANSSPSYLEVPKLTLSLSPSPSPSLPVYLPGLSQHMTLKKIKFYLPPFPPPHLPWAAELARQGLFLSLEINENKLASPRVLRVGI